jgi:hypothetical protein
MHLQQTKVESRATGGPQYYFHDVPDTLKDFLRRKGACPVVLQTPYGIARSPFMAVGRDHKLDPGGRAVSGKVGHDRIQQATGDQSIGEAIRHWYGLAGGRDFWRIHVEAVIHPEGHFILIPTAVVMMGAKRGLTIEKVHAPLSFHHDHQSKLWRNQIRSVRKESPADVSWAAAQIRRVVEEHRDAQAKHIQEADLLRTAGALSVLGLELSPYLGKGYDCATSRFRFSCYPAYPCPVEVKKRSSGFQYQITRYARLPRAVVLCMEHNGKNLPDDIDIIELPALAEHLSA